MPNTFQNAGTLRKVNWNLQLTSLQAIGWIPLEVPEQGKGMLLEWFRKMEGEKLLIMKIR